MKRYLLTSHARQDLDDIKAYLAEEAGVHVARYVIRQIKAALDFLSRMPEAGHIREDLTRGAVKFWTVSSYMVVYDPNTKPIEIVRVLHGSRNVEVVLDKGNE